MHSINPPNFRTDLKKLVKVALRLNAQTHEYFVYSPGIRMFQLHVTIHLLDT